MTLKNIEQEIFTARRSLTNIKTEDNSVEVNNLIQELNLFSSEVDRIIISLDPPNRTAKERALRRKRRLLMRQIEDFISQQAFHIISQRASIPEYA